MRRDIASLVVTGAWLVLHMVQEIQYLPVNCDIEPKEFDERWVLSVAKEGGQIPGVILAGVDSRDLALAVNVTEDAAGDVRKLGNPVKKVSTETNLEMKTTHKSMQSSKTGPQYSFFETPCWYAFANVESWLS